MNGCFVRAIVSVTVAASIALHAVLGCCWHHAHESVAAAAAAQGKSATPVKQVKGTCCRGACKKHSPSSEQKPLRQGSKEPCSPPCGKQCDTMAIAGVTYSDATAVAVIVLGTLDHPLLFPVRLGARGEQTDVKVKPPPLRLHLLHQLLLI